MPQSFQGPLGPVQPITNKPKGPQRVQASAAPSQGGLASSPEARQPLMESLLLSIATDKDIKREANIYQYIDAYRERGEDIVKWYEVRKKTAHVTAIQEDFIHNKENYVGARLSEMLPLLANKPGRLGDYITANVTKTAKQDDQGNSFVDLVIEVSNKFIEEKDAPRDMQDVPAKMTFLVDTTIARDLAAKIAALQDNYLVRGEKANVKCYKTSNGDLGIVRPKVIVAKSAEYIEKVGASLGGHIKQIAGDKFIISNQNIFDEEYRKYFMDMMTAIGENAQDSINYMQKLVPDQKRQLLIADYKKIVKFVEAYKKTPVTKKQKA